MAVTVLQDNRAVPGGDVAKPWRERIKQAQQDRSRYEPNWQIARAFASGKHWLKWSRRQRRLVLPPVAHGRERYSVEEIAQYRAAAVGELSHDDNLPTLLFRHDDIASREYTKQANDALRYALDEEIRADDILLDLKFALVDLGTAAIRCHWDANAGPIAGHLPAGTDGQPVTDQTVLDHLEQNGAMPDGSLPQYVAVNDGLIRWEVGAPENLLVPAGIEYQRDFPWEIWVRPVPIRDLIDEYGPVAEGLQEEPLAALQMLGSRELGAFEDSTGDTEQPGKLTDHVLVYTCFERPTRRKPKGETVVLAGSKEMRPLSAPRDLPYCGPDGVYRSGIVYFHYTRVPGRFWGRGLIDQLKDPQRMIDRRRTQISETIDRGQPFVLVQKGNKPDLEGKTGTPVEIIEIESMAGGATPLFHQGMQPGPWMQAEVESLREDLTRASGIQSVTLGENPSNVGNYSQLALLRESDQIKRLPTIKRFQNGTVELIENTVHDIRTHWGHEKQVTVAGQPDDDGDAMLQTMIFEATKVPAFFKVMVPKGAAKPMTQGAKLQLIQDIATYSINAQQPLPVEWYVESYKAGEMQPLPEKPAEEQHDKALMENVLMIQGFPAVVAAYDDPAIHIPAHQELLIHADETGRTDVSQLVEQHIAEHQAAAQMSAPPQPSLPAVGPGSPQAPNSGPPMNAPAVQPVPPVPTLTPAQP